MKNTIKKELDKLERSIRDPGGSGSIEMRWNAGAPYKWIDEDTGEERSGSREKYLEAGNILVDWNDLEGEAKNE